MKGKTMSKVGRAAGRAGYRTPSVFRYKKSLEGRKSEELKRLMQVKHQK